jgi:hypothetical protein
MTRIFTIRHTPNDKGFPQFTVQSDDGKPYMDRKPPTYTNNPLDCIKACAAFLADKDIDEGRKI